MFYFFFNDTATTEIYTLSLHDALPIYRRIGDAADIARAGRSGGLGAVDGPQRIPRREGGAHVDARHVEVELDRKSTRLNSSHANISYAVFCLKKKKKNSIMTCRYVVLG